MALVWALLTQGWKTCDIFIFYIENAYHLVVRKLWDGKYIYGNLCDI